MFNRVTRKNAVHRSTLIGGSKAIDTIPKPVQDRVRVKRGLTLFIKQIINNMMYYVDGSAILKKVCNNHYSDKLGEFRAIVISILDVTTSDLSMVQSCTNIFNREAHTQLQKMVTRRLRPIPQHQIQFEVADLSKSKNTLNTDADIVTNVLADYKSSQRYSLLTMFDYICRARGASRERQIEIAQKLVPPLPYSKTEHIQYPRRSSQISRISGMSANRNRKNRIKEEDEERQEGRLTEEDEKILKQLESKTENLFSRSTTQKSSKKQILSSYLKIYNLIIFH